MAFVRNNVGIPFGTFARMFSRHRGHFLFEAFRIPIVLSKKGHCTISWNNDETAAAVLYWFTGSKSGLNMSVIPETMKVKVFQCFVKSVSQFTSAKSKRSYVWSFWN